MSQRNPLNRYRRDADSVTSPPVSESTAPQADVPTSPNGNESASPNGSTSARKQEDKPTKSYRLPRSLTRAVARWAFDHEMSESAAAEKAFRWLLSQED